MYAIVETGGKQYRLAEGQLVDVEKLDGEPDAEVVLDKVLLVEKDGDVKVGTPHVSGAKVIAKVVKQAKAPKVLVFKYKPKKRYRKKFGHRQPYTRLQVEKIEA